MVVMGVVFLASGKDVLVVVGSFFFVVLGWVSTFGSTPYLSHGFLSRFPYKVPDIVTGAISWKLVD